MPGTRDTVILPAAPSAVDPALVPFPGGDPRAFTPDPHRATADQRRDHRVACWLWDEAEAKGGRMKPEEDRPGFTVGADGGLVLVAFAPDYGPGTWAGPGPGSAP